MSSDGLAGRASSSKEYWHEYMKDADECRFPALTDGVEGSASASSTCELRIDLLGLTKDALDEFCMLNALTPLTLFKAVWTLVLARYTGTSGEVGFAYSSCQDGDGKAEGSHAVGLCRVQIDETATVMQFLSDVEKDFRRARPHLVASLDDLFAAASTGGTAAFDTLVHCQQQSDATCCDVEVSEGGPVPNLKLRVEVCETEVKLTLQWASEHLSSAQAANVGGTFAKALTQIFTDQYRFLGDLDLLSSVQRRQIESWNSECPAAVPECAHDVIRRRVEAQPEAIAVTSREGDFTYRELDDLSTRLALHLAESLGVGPEVIVPLCFEKSIWTVVAMLGVIKAGGAMVFLEPSHPVARLEQIMAQVKAKLVLTSPQCAQLGATFGTPVVVVTRDFVEKLPAAHDLQKRISKVRPENIFYVVFTWGRTGKLKGCVVEHSAFCTAAIQHSTKFSIRADTRTLQLASYSLDISILETITSLMVGACVCVVVDQAAVYGIVSVMNEMRITWAFLTPSLAKLIKPVDVPHLRTLVLGGEPLSRLDVETWGDRVQLINCYGPSECTIAAAGNPRVTPSTDPSIIGRATGGLCWIVDPIDHTRLVPIGAVGELLIEGPILARGYLNNPEKTNEVFINDPAWATSTDDHSKRQRRRYYKTGDLVRYNSNGEITLIGRKDTQRKPRRQRLELREIEHHLSAHATVQHVYVMLPKSGRCEHHLVAVIVLKTLSVPHSGDGDVDLQLVEDGEGMRMAASQIAEIRASLGRHLPEYMIPTVWAVVQRVPLTASGKLNRAEVSKWITSMDEEAYHRMVVISTESTTYSGSRRLATGVGRGSEEVSGNNLFANTELSGINTVDRGSGTIAGMTTKGATKLRKRLQEIPGQAPNPSPREVTQNKSSLGSAGNLISGTGIKIHNPVSSESLPEPVSHTGLIERETKGMKEIFNTAFELSAVQTIFTKVVTANQRFHQSRLVRLTRVVQGEALSEAIKLVVARHSALRSRFETIDGGKSRWTQRIPEDVDGTYAFDMHHLKTSQEVRPLLQATHDRLSITKGPVFAVALLNIDTTDAKQQLLFFVAHRLIVDEISWRVVVEDLETVLFTKDATSVLPPISSSLSFQAWVKLQYDHYLSQSASRHERADVQTAPDFGYWGMTSKSNVVGDSLRTDFVMDWDIMALLLENGSKAVSHTEPIDLLFSALAGAFSHTFQDRKLPTVYLEDYGRKIDSFRYDWGRTVGCFSTIRPVQTDIVEGMELGERVRRARDARIGSSVIITGDVTPQMEVCLNYSGLRQQSGEESAVFRLERLVDDEPVEDVGSDVQRLALIEISAELKLGQLRVSFTFNRHMHHQARLSAWVSRWQFLLSQVLVQVKTMSLGHTSSDSPLANFGSHQDTRTEVRGRLSTDDAVKSDGSRGLVNQNDTQGKVGEHHVGDHSGTRDDIKSTGIVDLVGQKDTQIGVLDQAGDIENYRSTGDSSEYARIMKSAGTTKSTGIKSADVIKSAGVVLAAGIIGAAGTVKSANTVETTKLIESTDAVGSTDTIKSYGTIKSTSIVKSVGTGESAEIIESTSIIKSASNIDSAVEAADTVHLDSLKETKVEVKVHGKRAESGGTEDHLSSSPGSRKPTGITKAADNTKSADLISGKDTQVEVKVKVAEVGRGKEYLSSVHGSIRSAGVVDSVDTTKSAETLNLMSQKDTGIEVKKVRDQHVEDGEAEHHLSAHGSSESAIQKDTQDEIEIYGQRVKISEIEHHLSTHDSIKSAVVLLPQTGLCKQLLVVSVVLHGQSPTPTSETEVRMVSGTSKEAVSLQLTAMRQQLADHVPSYMVPELWVAVEAIPLTKSGKLDRVRMANWIESINMNTYKEIMDIEREADGPANARERKVHEIWSQTLNIPRLAFGQSFSSLGGDSITAMQVVSRCRAEGIIVSVRDVLQSPNSSHLLFWAKSTDSSIYADEIPGQVFDLSPMQQLYFEQSLSQRTADKGSYHYNQSVCLRLMRHTEAHDVARAIEAIVDRHSMLRARFIRKEDKKWAQLVVAELSNSYSFNVHEVERQQVTMIAAERQAALDIEHGPVFAADLFNLTGDGGQLLFVVAHHLIIDLLSWRVILRDIEELLEQGTTSAPKPLSFQTWCGLQADYSRGHLIPENALPKGMQVGTADFDYWGMSGRENIYNDRILEQFTINEAITSNLLGDCNRALHTEPTEVILTVLFHSFRQVFNRSPPTIFLQGHGREPWDAGIYLAETVGCFTTICPLHVPVDHEANMVDVLRRTKATRRSIPRNGWRYFASRYHHPEGQAKFAGHGNMEILFNYMGRYQSLRRDDALFRFESLDGDSDVGKDVKRLALFEISVAVMEDTIRVSFSFNRHMKHADSIRSWIQVCKLSFESLVETLSHTSKVRTLSDSSFVSRTQIGLEKLRGERMLELGSSVSADDLEDAYPCSPMQYAILDSHSKSHGKYELNQIYEVLPRGGISIDLQRFRAAWQKVVDRHPSLRTIFIATVSNQEEVFDQVVLKRFKADIVVIERDDTSDIIEEMRRQPPVNYEEPIPHHRLTICKTSSRLLCMVTIRQTLVDGISIPILIQDFARAYEGNLSTDSGMPYSDYIAYSQKLPIQLSLDYWDSYLTGIHLCSFPNLGGNAELSASINATGSVTVSFNNMSQIRGFCKKHSVAIATIFQFAWGLVLRTYTKSDSFCFGYLASGRDFPVKDVKNAIGQFDNLIVCRLNVAKTAPVMQVIKTLQNDFVHGLSYQHLPPLDNDLFPDFSRQRLFNTILSYQRLPFSDMFEQATIAFADIDRQNLTDYDLAVEVAAGDQEFRVTLSYPLSHMSDEQATNVASTLENAVSAILQNESGFVRDLEMFSHRNHMEVPGWNDAVSAPVVEACVHKIIKQQTFTSLDAPAVCSWDGELTYAELDKLSSRLAHRLAGLNIGPEVRVLLCFEKSRWMIVAMLAVLKAGGTCVPLTPSQPITLIEEIVRDTEASVVLASPQCEGIFETLVPNTITVEGSLWDTLSESTEDCATVQPTNSAFVIYTPGPTGVPQGVVLKHNAFCTSSRAYGTVCNIDRETRTLQFAAYTLHASLQEIFSSLQRGACVCVISEDNRTNHLAEGINATRANLANLTSAVARLIRPADSPTIKTLIVTDDAAKAEVVGAWAAHATVLNSHGHVEPSTKTTRGARFHGGEQAPTTGRVPTEVVPVVDNGDHNQLTPASPAGEPLVEGSREARSDLKDAFIKASDLASQSRTSEQQMRETEGSVPYIADRTLDKLSRKDTQTDDVRSQRVELSEAKLGEIEHLIKAKILNIERLAVDVIPPSLHDGEEKVALFLELPAAGEDGAPDDATPPIPAKLKKELVELKASLIKSLPFYMIPSLCVPLKRLPVNASGKLDRRKLRQVANAFSEDQLARYSLENEDKKRAPVSSVGVKSQSVLAEALHAGPKLIGADDNPIGVAQNSLEAARVAGGAGRTVAKQSTSNENEKQAAEATKSSRKDFIADHVENIATQGTGSTVTPLREGLIDTHLEISSQRVESEQINGDVKTRVTTLQTVSVDAVGPEGRQILETIQKSSIEDATDDCSDEAVLPATGSLQSNSIQPKASPAAFVPSHMISSIGGLLRRSPLSSIGKLDQRSLDVSSNASSEKLATYSSENVQKRAPTTTPELKLHQLWCQVLNATAGSIGVEDDFFAVGGDSLGVVQLVAAARKLNIVLTVADVVGNPKLADMAKLPGATETHDVLEVDDELHLKPFVLCAEMMEAQSGFLEEVASQCNVSKDRIQDIYPCTSLQEELIDVSTAREQGAYATQRVFRVPKTIDLQRFKEAWQTLLGLQPILRTRIIRTTSSIALQVVIIEEQIKWHEESSLDAYLQHDKEVPIVEGEPMARYAIISEGPDRHFVWTVHYALYDGWSARILFEQIERLYRQEDAFKRRPVPYTRFINYLKEVNSKGAHDFWHGQLGGETPTSFPQRSTTSQPKPDKVLHHSVQVTRRSGSRIMMSSILRTAWATTVAQYSKSDDVVFAIALSGRNAPVADVTEILGSTVTTVPMRIRFDYTQSSSSLLKQVQRQAAEMVPFEHTGLQNIRRLGLQDACNLQHIFIVHDSREKDTASTFLGLKATAAHREEFGTYALILECTIEQGTGKVNIGARFDSAMVNLQQMQWLLDQFEHVICQLNNEDSNLRLGDLDLVRPLETSSTAKSQPKMSAVDTDRRGGNLVGATMTSNLDRSAPVVSVHGPLHEGSLLERDHINAPEKIRGSSIKGTARSPLTGPGSERRTDETGRLVHDASEGTPSLVDRRDEQLEVNNQRAEIDKIENHISSHDSVRSTIVVSPKTGFCKKRLVAVVSLKDFSTTITNETVGIRLIGDTLRESASHQVANIRQRLLGQLPEYLVPTRWAIVEAIPLTESKKLDRMMVLNYIETANEHTYLSFIETDSDSGPDASATAVERHLRAIWSRILNVPLPELGFNRSFMSLGGDSVTATQVVSQCRSEGISVTVRDVLQSSSISQLGLRSKKISSQPLLVINEVLNEPFELSPTQKIYFEQIAPQASTSEGSYQFNQSFTLRLTRHIETGTLTRAIEALVSQHSMLRSRFLRREKDGRYSQIIASDLTGSYRLNVHELKGRDQAALIAGKSQVSLDIEKGPVFSIDLFNISSDEVTKEQLIFLTVHRLVIDLVSWRILLRDLEELLRSGTLSAPKPLPFQTWCQLQSEYSSQHLGRKTPLPIETSPAHFKYWGMTGRINMSYDHVPICFTLNEASTSMLFGKCNEALMTEPVDIILSAFFHAFREVFVDRSTPTIFNEGHGREPWDSAPVDLSETVGWFTTISPVWVPVARNEDILTTLRRVKDTRTVISENSWQYSTGGYLNPMGLEELGSHREMEVLFRSIGRYRQLEREDALLRLDHLDPLSPNGEKVSDIGKNVHRLALFDISVTVVDACTRVSFSFNRHMDYQSNIRRWVDIAKDSLELLIDRLVEPGDLSRPPRTYTGVGTLKRQQVRQDEAEQTMPMEPHTSKTRKGDSQRPKLSDMSLSLSSRSINGTSLDQVLEPFSLCEPSPGCVEEVHTPTFFNLENALEEEADTTTFLSLETALEEPTLARQYPNLVKKTSRSSIEDSTWVQLQSERLMHKTGDSAHDNSDSTLNFVGQKDVDLGRMEGDIKLALPDLQQVVAEAITVEGVGERRALTAFLIFPHKKEISGDDSNELILPIPTQLQTRLRQLQASLTKTLPSHMIPSMFIPLRRLPLDNSGKLDRKQLHHIAKTLSKEQLIGYTFADMTKEASSSSEMEVQVQKLSGETLKIAAKSTEVDKNSSKTDGNSVGDIHLTTKATRSEATLKDAETFEQPKLSDMSKIAGSVTTTKVDGPVTKLVPSSPSQELKGVESRSSDLKEVTADEKSSRSQDRGPDHNTPLHEGLVTGSARRVNDSTNKGLYKPRDSVPNNPEGTFSSIDRKENQIKLQGQRIGIEEIEHHLLTQDSVRSAVVVLPTTGFHKQRLVGIVSLHSVDSKPASGSETEVQIFSGALKKTASIQISRIHSHLIKRVAEYMIPSIWIAVHNIPRMQSGKPDRVRMTRWVESIDEKANREVVDMQIETDIDSGSKAEMAATTSHRHAIWNQIQNAPAASLNKSFLKLGGDSVTEMPVKSTEESSVTIDNVCDQEFGLSSNQQRYFEQLALQRSSDNVAQHHSSQSFCLRVTPPVRIHDLTRGLQALVEHHSMLRRRFRCHSDGKWVQFITSDVSSSYRFEAHKVEVLDQVSLIASRRQSSLDIENGPLFTADIFDFEDGTQLLFLVAHYLIIDLVSWRVMLQELGQFLEEEALSVSSPFPFQARSRLLAGYNKQHLVSQKTPLEPVDLEYWAMSSRVNIYSDQEIEHFVLDETESSRLFGSCNDALHTEPVEIVLSALFYSFRQTFNRTPPVIYYRGHEKESWDVEMDMAGQTTQSTRISPLSVPVGEGDDILETLRRTKDARRRTSRNGWAEFAARFLQTDDKAALGGHSQMEILFNYLDRSQQLEQKDSSFRLGSPDDDLVPEVNKNKTRLALLDITMTVVGNATRISFCFNRHMDRQDTIRKWIGATKNCLQDLTSRLVPMKPEYTLSDFPLLPDTENGLEMLQGRLPEIGATTLDELENVYPCSPMQQGILIRHSKSPGVHMIYEILPQTASDGVDIQRLQNSWQQVVDRHASLRTVFIETTNQERLYDQIVLKRYSATVSCIHSEAGSDVAAELRRLPPLDYHVHQPHHRLTLCKTAEGRVFCLFEINYALIDSVSMTILMRDFVRAYENKLSMSSGPMYSNYISYLLQQSSSLDLDYWRSYLLGIRPSYFPSVGGDTQARQLRKHVTQIQGIPSLLHFCERHNVTLASWFQMAWSLVLNSYTHSEQACFGYLVSGRDIPVKGIEDAVGVFTNMMVRRVDLENTTSVVDTVKKIENDFIQGLNHQHYPLFDIERSLNLSEQQLVNTVLSYQEASSDEVRGPSSISFKEVEGQYPKEYDLIVNITAGKQDVNVSLVYCLSFMSDNEAANVTGRLQEVISKISQSQDIIIGELMVDGTVHRTGLQKSTTTFTAKQVEGSLSNAAEQAPSTEIVYSRPKPAYMTGRAAASLEGDDGQYKPFCLVDVPDIDSFLTESVCPITRCSRDNIVDVFPVTDFQTFVVAGSLTKIRWQLNYFTFDGDGPVKLELLKNSCLAVVRHFEMLRTVFILHENKFLQVILRDIDVDVDYHETEQDLDAFTLALQEKDESRKPRLGEPYVQFAVVKHKHSMKHRLIIRLSHAQYDEMCLPLIWNGLQAAFNGQPLPEYASFSRYVWELAHRNSDHCYDHWQKLLAGSSMTEVVAREPPHSSRLSKFITTAPIEIPIGALTYEGITSATVVKAAWAFALATLSARSDVVFGHVVAGRSGAIPQVETIIGACLNYAPVRVHFQQSWSVIELLRHVQHQQRSSAPFETLGFREIVRNCTQWPTWTRFSSVVQHQSIEAMSQIRLGDTVYDVRNLAEDEDLADLSIFSSARGQHFEICIKCSSDLIKSNMAEEILHQLQTTLMSFAGNPTMSLHSPATLRELKRRLPMAVSIVSETKALPDMTELQSIVIRVWNQTLGDEKDRRVSTVSRDSSFYEQGGDFATAAQLAVLFQQRGFDVTVEEMGNYPTQQAQLGLLFTKRLLRCEACKW